jgi:hypothetical protein
MTFFLTLNKLPMYGKLISVGTNSWYYCTITRNNMKINIQNRDHSTTVPNCIHDDGASNEETEFAKDDWHT